MAKTPEQILEDARNLIGAETELREYPFPVEYDPIRRYCHMTEDDNPLFLDPDYARTAGYGDVVCPPLFVRYFSSDPIWPPPAESTPALPPVPTAGNRAINLTTEFEFYHPVEVGDRLSSKRRIADVYIKPIRLDSKAFWTKTETLVYNQRGELVAMMSNLGLRHRTPEQIEEAGE